MTIKNGGFNNSKIEIQPSTNGDLTKHFNKNSMVWGQVVGGTLQTNTINKVYRVCLKIGYHLKSHGLSYHHFPYQVAIWGHTSFSDTPIYHHISWYRYHMVLLTTHEMVFCDRTNRLTGWLFWGPPIFVSGFLGG